MSDLLPCPFCGGDAGIEEIDNSPEQITFQANCNNEDCCAYQFICHSYDRRTDATKIWNTRAAPITPEQARDTLDRLGYFECMCEDCKELTPIITKALEHFAGKGTPE